MADLRELVQGVGTEDVGTYVQSGNVVFRSNLSRAKLERALAESIRRQLGLDVTVLVRTAAQLKKVVADNPFLERGADAAGLHVTFLASAPDPEHARRLGERSFAPDELHVSGDAVYLHCPNGYGRTKLGNTFLERQLATPATTRNWKTVTALAGLTA